MNGWFTTWTFWVGALWGASVGWLALWFLLVKPMARALGIEPSLSLEIQANVLRMVANALRLGDPQVAAQLLEQQADMLERIA